MLRRIVLDTSVIVAALRRRHGAGNRVLRLVARRHLILLATPPLFLKYEDVWGARNNDWFMGLPQKPLKSS